MELGEGLLLVWQVRGSCHWQLGVAGRECRQCEGAERERKKRLQEERQCKLQEKGTKEGKKVGKKGGKKQ